MDLTNLDLQRQAAKLDPVLAPLLMRRFYEEEEYTPELYGGTTAGTTTYSTQAGYYVRVGGLVLCYGAIQWTGATGTGETRVSLPFTSRSDGTRRWAVALHFADITYASSPFQGLLVGGNGYFRLEYATSNASSTVIPIEAAGTLIYTLVYEADPTVSAAPVALTFVEALAASSPTYAWAFDEAPGTGTAAPIAGGITLTLPGGQDFGTEAPFGGRIGGGTGPSTSAPLINRNTGSAVCAYYISGNVFGANSSWFTIASSGFDLTSYFEAPTSVTLFHPDGDTATATGVPTSGWVFLAATWDDASNTISIRLNNGTPATGTSSTTYATGGNLIAGSGLTSGDALGPLALYDRVLTSDEIDTLYDAFAAEVAAAVDTRITEAGDTRVTEAGDTRITE